MKLIISAFLIYQYSLATPFLIEYDNYSQEIKKDKDQIKSLFQIDESLISIENRIKECLSPTEKNVLLICFVNGERKIYANKSLLNIAYKRFRRKK